jgi:hypothetical protein
MIAPAFGTAFLGEMLAKSSDDGLAFFAGLSRVCATFPELD